jgi:diadenosine tetraphosphate (Ap4A) HIT family hydrolase
MYKLLSRIEYEGMIHTIPVKSCQFCNLEGQLILGSSEQWLWVPALSPYWKYHTMFVPKEHIEDITELTASQFSDLQILYQRVKRHMISLKLKHDNGKSLDQFMLTVRIREENIPNGSNYIKPKHLHIHFCPDQEGVKRFNLDSTAINVDIESIALPRTINLS